jgi:hypothetical protein
MLGLGVPLVVLLFGVLPVAVAVLMWIVRGRLTEPGIQRHIGFLYLHYRPQVYWWQVVELIQTLWLAVAASTAHRTGPFYSTLLANVVLALILFMLLRFKPMACRQVQLLAYASLGCQLLTTYAALTFLPMDAASSSQAATAGAWLERSLVLGAVKEMVGGLVLAVNVAFVVGLAVVLLRTLPREQLQAQWQRLQQEGRRARALLLQHLGVHAYRGQHRHAQQQELRRFDDAESEVQHACWHMASGGSGSNGGGRALQRLRALTLARFKDADVVAEAIKHSASV